MRNFKGEKNPFYGRKHTDESKRKMSLSHKGQIPWNKGKVGIYSEETLSKMKRPKSMEHRRKISIAKLEKSEEATRKRIRRFEDEIKADEKKGIAFGEILGTIPSDAYFGIINKRLYNYILASKDKEFVQRISGNFAEFNIKVKIHRRKSSLWYIETCRRWFKGFLPYLRKEGNKWIFSEKVLNSSSAVFKAAIIRSFADAEGSATCTTKDGKYFSRKVVMYNSIKILLSQIQTMLKKIRVNSYIHLARNERAAKIKHQIIKFSTTFALIVTGQSDIKKFYNEVGFGIPRKMEKLKEIISSYKCKDYSIEDYKKAFHLFEQFRSCKKVANEMGINTQVIRGWIIYGTKPRNVKLLEQ